MIVRRTSTDRPEDTELMLLGACAHLDLSHPAADHSRVPLSSYDLLLRELTITIQLTWTQSAISRVIQKTILSHMQLCCKDEWSN